MVGGHVVTIVSAGALHQNCHLVTDRSSGEIAIVDPGTDVTAILDAIRELGGAPKHLLVTHGHPDHIAGAAALTDELELDCLVAIRDERTLRHAPGYAAAFGLQRTRIPDRLQYIDDSTDLRLGRDRIEISSAPGHTPGGISIRIGDVVLTGDTLLREHVGRTDLPGSDRAAIVGSIDRLLAAAPPEAAILAGHGRPWTVAEATDWWVDTGRRAAAGDASPGRSRP